MSAVSHLRAVDDAASADLDRLAKAGERRGKTGDPPGADKRLVITVRKGRIHETVDAAEQALIASGQPFFSRGDILCRVATGVQTPGITRDPEAPVLLPASEPMLLETFEASARFESLRKLRNDHEEVIAVGCPPAVPKVYLSRTRRWRLPAVRSLSAVPLLRDDGSICYSGYDAGSRCLVADCSDWPRIPEAPTEAQARAAMLSVEALVHEFDYVGDADRAVALAAMLTALLRPGLPAAPAFGFDASAAGSGKSLNANLVAVLATGRPAAAVAWTARDEENAKRLDSAVLAGDAVILLDNVEVALRSVELCSLLTEQQVAIRPLGSSRLARVESATTVTITANNMLIAGDLTRRVLVCRLDPRCERPELRRFSFNPLEYAATHRRELVTGLLTLALWGRRQAVDLAPLGSFEVWSRRVRNPVFAFTGADPCACLDLLAAVDPEREMATALLTAWQRAFAGRPATAAEAIRRSTDGDADLRDALDAVAGGPGGIVPKRLGRALLRIRDRRLGGLVMRRGDPDPVARCATWRVEMTGP